ncbi:MAG TPA: lysophospholipid acyltransferase family protein [Gallionellaceae bacterium]|nr:lysophospholipid acyltransferase family protein [Gallionellaceae bacterium]
MHEHKLGLVMINSVVRGLDVAAAGFRTLYEYIALYISLAVFGMGGVLFSLLAAAIYPFLPRRFGARLGRLLVTCIFWPYLVFIQSTGLFKCDISALDALSNDESIIIVSNHPGLIDVVLVCSRLTNIVCIMKKEIQENILFGGCARLAGYICNDSTGNMVRVAVDELKQGGQLLIFPEGTRTVMHPVNKFTGAFALIARRAGVPVQTVFIEYTSAFLGKGWPLWRKPQFPLTFRVTLGKRFEVGSDIISFVDDLENYFRERLVVKKSD